MLDAAKRLAELDVGAVRSAARTTTGPAPTTPVDESTVGALVRAISSA